MDETEGAWLSVDGKPVTVLQGKSDGWSVDHQGRWSYWSEGYSRRERFRKWLWWHFGRGRAMRRWVMSQWWYDVALDAEDNA